VIPFNKPVFLGSESDRLIRAIRENAHLAGRGPFGRQCEKHLETRLGLPSLLVTSCTHALEMAGLLLNLGPGDEVILPSYTFVSTATAFALRGVQLVFADVDVNGNLDLHEVEKLLGPRTRAVVAVHYAGNSCDLPRLIELCDDVPVVEDAAQAIGAAFEGRPLGTFGPLSAFSFHETKNVSCGEGGALVLGSEQYLDRAQTIRDKGTNRQSFLDGMVDKYTWVDVGSSYALSDLNAAYLVDQLDQLDRIQARRHELFDRYARELDAPLEHIGAERIHGHPRNTPNHHLFGIVFRQPQERAEFIAFMGEHGILTPFHYVALHSSPMGRKFHPSGRPLPQSDRLTECLVRLPLFFNMTDAQSDEVTGRALEFLRAR
jgi:dTDP-4-amino-4,6-dideoxygalactose transaminase